LKWARPAVDVLPSGEGEHGQKVVRQIGSVVFRLPHRCVAHGLLRIGEIQQIDLVTL